MKTQYAKSPEEAKEKYIKECGGEAEFYKGIYLRLTEYGRSVSVCYGCGGLQVTGFKCPTEGCEVGE